MKVLVADKFEKVGIDGLKELGCTVVSQPDVKADELPMMIRQTDPHILIVRGKKVSRRCAQGRHRADPGDPCRGRHRYDRRGHGVESGRLRLQLSRKELDRGGGAGDGAAARLRPAHPRSGGRPSSGPLEQGRVLQGAGLYGRTLGIVGLGQIGREIAARAQAFGMRVVAWSRSLTHEEADRLGVMYAQTPLEVARLSDAVSINVAANAETKHLVERGVPGRDAAGGVSHQHVARLGGGRGGAEAGDRGEGNPRRARRLPERAGGSHRPTSPARIVQVPGVYGTHHVGASTEQAQVAIAHEVIRIVQAFRPPARSRTSSTASPAARRPTCSRSGTETGPASWRTSSACWRGRRSTWKRWRTSSTTAPRPRWRGSISTASPTTAPWTGSGRQPDIISVELSEIDGRGRRAERDGHHRSSSPSLVTRP